MKITKEQFISRLMMVVYELHGLQEVAPDEVPDWALRELEMSEYTLSNAVDFENPHSEDANEDQLWTRIGGG